MIKNLSQDGENLVAATNEEVASAQVENSENAIRGMSPYDANLLQNQINRDYATKEAQKNVEKKEQERRQQGRKEAAQQQSDKHIIKTYGVAKSSDSKPSSRLENAKSTAVSMGKGLSN